MGQDVAGQVQTMIGSAEQTDSSGSKEGAVRVVEAGDRGTGGREIAPRPR